jgi:hypothetical protein
MTLKVKNRRAEHALGFLLPFGVDAASKEAIEKIATMLPTDRQGFFECHLAQTGKVDFAVPVSIHNNQKELQQLAHLFPREEYLGQFLVEGMLYEHNALRNIWLEFDTSEGVHISPSGVFFELVPAVSKPEEYWQQLFKDILPLTGTPYYTPVTAATMLRCIENINAGFVAHIGVMTGRGGELRLCSKFANPLAAMDYLHTTYSPLPQQTMDKLTRLLNLADIACVNYDFDNGVVQNKIGIELHVSKNRGNQTHLETLFHSLENYGLCSRTQTNSLIQWQQDENKYNADFLYKMSHIKITIESGQIQAAKAYVTYAYSEEHSIN